jgi:hypothetical protein
VFIASWRIERPLADIALGPMPDVEASISLLVARDLERSEAETKFQKREDVPVCDCTSPAHLPTASELKKFTTLHRPDELLIVPRAGSRQEKFVAGDQAGAIAEAFRSGSMTLPNFIDPRDGKAKLAAFAALQPVDAPGATPRTVVELAPLLMVTTDREVLNRYISWIKLAGGLLLAAILVLLFCFVWSLARGDDEKLRWLRGSSP